MIKELIFELIKSRKLTKVYHIKCGGHVGYVADSSKKKSNVDNFYFLDGTHPRGCDTVAVHCQKCGETIKFVGDMCVRLTE